MLYDLGLGLGYGVGVGVGVEESLNDGKCHLWKLCRAVNLVQQMELIKIVSEMVIGVGDWIRLLYWEIYECLKALF